MVEGKWSIKFQLGKMMGRIFSCYAKKLKIFGLGSLLINIRWGTRLRKKKKIQSGLANWRYMTVLV